MILTFITGSFALVALTFVIALVQIGFWFTFGIIFIALASILAGIALLTAWATGRRPAA